MQNLLRKIFKWRLMRLLIVIIGIYCICTILGLILGSDYVYPLFIRWLKSGEPLFHFDVADGYQLDSHSAGVVKVVPKDARTKYGEVPPHIPPKVVKLAWNERFVIAKQQIPQWQMPNRTLLQELLPHFQYWILDASNHKVYGPLDKSEFKAQRVTVGVPDSLVLKRVSSYRK